MTQPQEADRPRNGMLDGRRRQVRNWLDRPRPDRTRGAELAVRIVRLAATAVVVALAAAVALRPRSSVLDTRTHIMGYPVVNGFSPAPYELTYVASILLVLLAIGVYLALGAVPALRAGRRSIAVDLGPTLQRPLPTELTPFVAAVRSGTVALVLAAQVALIAGLRGTRFLAPVLVVAALAAVVGAVVVRRRSDAGPLVARAVAAGGLATLVGLGAVSATSWIDTTSGRRDVDWFPWWAVLAVLAVALGVLWRRHRGRPLDAIALSSDVLLGVVGPVALLLCSSRLTGMLGLFDMFHEGESLVPATALRGGGVPWRDFMFIHGLLQDVFWAIPGLVFLEDSRWGAFAGQLLWMVPLYWLTHYVLAAWLFRTRRWMIGLFVVVVASGPALLGGSLVAFQFRMVLHPILLVAMGALIQRVTWPRAALLGGLAAVDLFIAPETALVILPIGGVLVLVEVDRWWREGRADLSRLLRTAACGLAGLGVVAAYLLSVGAMSGVIDWFETFTGDHRLTGSRPVQWELGRRFQVEVWLTAAIPLVAIAFVAARRRIAGVLAAREWVVLALALGALAYYPKFLARPDFHIEHVWPLAVPVGFYLAAEAIDALDRLVRRGATGRIPGDGRWLRPAAVAVVVAMFAPCAVDVVDHFRLGATRFRPEVGPTVDIPRVGYFNGEGNLTPQRVRRIDDALEAMGARTEGFFDFTNTPGLFHYILGLPTATPFYNVSMAIRANAQRELIDDLEASRPQVVAWSAPVHNFGLPSWDGVSNQVRHYLVAEWIIDHYEPYVTVGGYGFWVRSDARPNLPDPAAIGPDDNATYVDQQEPECTWGRATRYLDARPSAADRRRGIDLDLEEANGVLVRGWAITPLGIAERVLVIVDGQVVTEGEPSVFRPDIVFAKGGTDRPNRYQYAGFELFLDRTDRAVDVERMQVVAVDARGRGTMIDGSPGADLPLPDIDGVTMDPTAFEGSLDGFPNVEGDGTRLFRTRVTAEQAERTDWIEFGGGAPAPVPVEVAALPDDPRRVMSAVLMPGAPARQYLRVGSCGQWRTVDGWLYFVVRGNVEPTDVRLVP